MPGRVSATTRVLVDEELAYSVAWLIRLRWLASLGVILAALFVIPLFGLDIPRLPLTTIGLGIFLYNLFFFLTTRRLHQRSASIGAYRTLAISQVGLDWLAMILLIHFSGGIESPAIFFFIFHIIIASIFFPPRTAFAFAILAIVLLTITTVLELSSILPHYPIGGYLNVPLYQNRLYAAIILLFFSSTGLIAVYLTTSIQDRLSRQAKAVINLTDSLRQATIRLQALNESAQTLSSTLELEQVLDRLVKNTAEIMGIEACSIRLLSKGGERLEIAAVHGLSQAYIDKGPVELENNRLAQEVLAGKIVNIPDAATSALLQYPDWVVKEGISSMLSVPLIGKNGPLGIVRAYCYERNHFTPEDEVFLTTIAGQGSIAIENALAYQAVAALDTQKSSFIRTVTHELRSPVSVTRSLLRTITAGYSGDVNEQQKDILDRAIRRIDFLQKLIDDLLDLAAGKANLKAQAAVEPIAVEAILKRLVERFSAPATEKRIQLEFQDETEGPCRVMSSQDDLDRIFNNLLSNAVKYTPGEGRVVVTLRCCEGEARISVEDTGIGIPDDASEQLFEEFYRAANAKAFQPEGTGLGLTIVKDLVTRLGGRISVHSRPGLGTRFTVQLPLAADGQP